MRAVNAAVMRRFNRQLILNRIRKGPVSRMELAEATGLTRASVAQIVEQLIGEGIVVETLRSGRERSGRRSTQLTVVGSAGMIFGVSLNAERCEVGAINLRGDTLSRSAELVSGRSLQEVLEAIAGAIQRQSEALGKPAALRPSIGVCVPNAWLSEDDCEQMAAYLTRATQMEVRIECTAHALALEHLYFAHVPANFALLRVDEALTASVVLEGQLIRGARRTALAVGRVHARGDGWLDGWASVPALLRDTPYPSWTHLMEHAHRPDAAAAIDRAVSSLAPVAIATLNVFGLDRLVLAGLSGDALLARMNEAVSGRTVLAARSPVMLALPENPVRTGAMPAYHAFFGLELD